MEKLALVLGLVALLGASVYLYNTENTTQLRSSAPSIEPDVVDLYSDWKKKYNKKYASPDQDWYRLTVFNDNYKVIKDFYEGPEQTYSLDFTQFMDLTNEEFVSTYLGYTQVDKENAEAFQASGDANAVDWRDKNVLNDIRNQGACGSCWAFSAVGAIEAAHAVAGNKLPSLSEQELVDCATGTYGNLGCNGGLMTSAFQYVIDHGLTNRADYPYAARNQACKKQQGDARISSYKTVSNCADLESAVTGRPVSVAVDASKWQFYGGGVFSNCAKNLNHGVVLVASNASEWVIRNSWGATWGEKGHIRLAKGDTCGVCSDAAFPVV